jgi:hypothetical protein
MVPTPRGLRPPEDELLRGCPDSDSGVLVAATIARASHGLDRVFGRFGRALEFVLQSPPSSTSPCTEAASRDLLLPSAMH